MATLAINRWLGWLGTSKHNKQKAYLSIPVFSHAAYSISAVSHIIAQYNFSTTNNFSLETPIKPVDCNFILCVKFRVGGVVTRYKLWDGTTSDDTVNFETYNGEVIKKNCVFEIWKNGDVDTVDNLEVLIIPLSIVKAKGDISNANTYENAVGVVVTELHNTNNDTEGTTTPPTADNLVINAFSVEKTFQETAVDIPFVLGLYQVKYISGSAIWDNGVDPVKYYFPKILIKSQGGAYITLYVESDLYDTLAELLVSEGDKYSGLRLVAGFNHLIDGAVIKLYAEIGSGSTVNMTVNIEKAQFSIPLTFSAESIGTNN